VADLPRHADPVRARTPTIGGAMRALSAVLCAVALGGLVALPTLSVVSGCAGIRETIALRQVDFWLEGVHDVNLAGIRLAGVRGIEDLTASASALILAAYGDGNLPLRMVLDVVGENPQENPDARLTGLEWSLLVRDRETVEGVLTGPIPLPSGRATTFPVAVQVDLMQYFQNDLPALVDLAAEVARAEANREDPGYGALVPVALLARPVIETPAGPIRYPGLIRIGVR
jgi:hypothetical protein